MNQNPIPCKVVVIGESGNSLYELFKIINYNLYPHNRIILKTIINNLITFIGVGKTSIITRYMNNTYYSNFIPTMGNCYASKIIDFQEKDKRIKFEVKNKF